MQTSASPPLPFNFVFPSIVDIISARRGGKTIIIIGILLALLQLVLAIMFQFELLQWDTKFIIFPIRIAIVCAWGFFIYSNYKSYMQGSRFMVMIEFLMTGALTAYLNSVYNKIQRQCFTTIPYHCSVDPDFSMLTNWLVLMAPLGLSISPMRILSFFPAFALQPQSVSLLYAKDKIIAFDEIIHVICSMHWLLYLDGIAIDILPFDPFWLYAILYVQTLSSILVAWLQGDDKYIWSSLHHLFINWPPMIYFTSNYLELSYLRFLMFLPFIIYLCLKLSEHINKTKKINPMQDMMNNVISMMTGRMFNDESMNNQYARSSMQDFHRNIAAAMMGSNNIPTRTDSSRNQLLIASFCEHCGASGAIFKCSQCGGATYCDRDCQRENWSRHRYHCDAALD